MKRCVYCGKEYSDEVAVCTTDGQPVTEAAPLQSLPLRSVVSIILFSVLSTFTGVGVAWTVVARIANHMTRTSGATHVNALVGTAGDTFVARSIPILIAGGLLGLIAGAVGKYVSERRKLASQPGAPPLLS